ncbi:MAG: hypothetical protein AAFR65_11910 [Pseudomonadota bacterium]
MMIKSWYDELSPAMKTVAIALGAIALYGVVLRLLPLFQGAEAIAFRFVSEDGYLLLTVSRNLAIGEGMSVSEGTIATNGVQPLITFVFTLPFLASGGDKIGGLVGVGLIMVAISAAGGWAVYRFVRQTLAVQSELWVWPALAAVVWFVALPTVAHSMNALETGLYTALAATTFTYFGSLMNRGGVYTRRDQVILGSLCGLCFLARIDGAFLVTAIFATRFLVMQFTRQLNFKDAVLEALPPGFLSLAFAAPWLIHNQLRFGSIMPISGPAQSLNSTFGGNLHLLPAKIYEQIFVFLPIPNSIETKALAILFCMMMVLAVLVPFYWLQFKNSSPMRWAAVAYGLFGLALMAYYGLFFGAPYFLPRYTFPLSPLGVAALVSVLLWAVTHLPKFETWLKVGAAAGALAIALVLTSQRYVLSPVSHDHRQVVRWVDQNVYDETWVAAVQTGTLGFWHDRTINLDGKVNPAALQARIDEGHVLNYVTASDIDVLADWRGIATWPQADIKDGAEAFGDAFDVLIADQEKNLGVQIRRGTILKAASSDGTE